jgi:hypothetical protein
VLLTSGMDEKERNADLRRSFMPTRAWDRRIQRSALMPEEITGGQCLAVRGRGSGSAALRRPQFKQAKTVMASPASKSTARSGNIAPRHLSHVFI